MTQNENKILRQFKSFILKGRAAVFIDWANVHGWEKSLKREVDRVNKMSPRLLGGRDCFNYIKP